MASHIRTKAELDRAFLPGWSLYPRRLDPGFILQEGEPGRGGKSMTVTSRAVEAFLKDHSVRRIGGVYDWHYIRQDKT